MDRGKRNGAERRRNSAERRRSHPVLVRRSVLCVLQAGRGPSSRRRVGAHLRPPCSAAGRCGEAAVHRATGRWGRPAAAPGATRLRRDRCSCSTLCSTQRTGWVVLPAAQLGPQHGGSMSREWAMPMQAACMQSPAGSLCSTPPQPGAAAPALTPVHRLALRGQPKGVGRRGAMPCRLCGAACSLGRGMICETVFTVRLIPQLSEPPWGGPWWGGPDRWPCQKALLARSQAPPARLACLQVVAHWPLPLHQRQLQVKPPGCPPQAGVEGLRLHLLPAGAAVPRPRVLQDEHGGWAWRRRCRSRCPRAVWGFLLVVGNDCTRGQARSCCICPARHCPAVNGGCSGRRGRGPREAEHAASPVATARVCAAAKAEEGSHKGPGLGSREGWHVERPFPGRRHGDGDQGRGRG